MTSAFVNTFALVKNVSDIYFKNKVRFYLQVLPFAPAILGTSFVFLAHYCLMHYFLIYRFVIALALAWIGNFICAMYLAYIIGIPALIVKGEMSNNVK